MGTFINIAILVVTLGCSYPGSRLSETPQRMPLHFVQEREEIQALKKDEHQREAAGEVRGWVDRRDFSDRR